MNLFDYFTSNLFCKLYVHSAASENMGSSSDVGYEINNVGGATKTLIKVNSEPNNGNDHFIELLKIIV